MDLRHKRNKALIFKTDLIKLFSTEAIYLLLVDLGVCEVRGDRRVAIKDVLLTCHTHF